MSPKSLLRHKDCVSNLSDFTQGQFQTIIDDKSANKEQVKKIVFCSGKVYFDLKAYQQTRGYQHIAIIRVEQFYPLEQTLFNEIIKSYPSEAEIVWCQEEPKNMGGWTFMLPYFLETSKQAPRYVGRKASASPAVGSLAIHKHEQAKLVSDALDS